jgi:uncharacterized metal-binding protein
MPVLFACRGCERDAAAREVARLLDRRGVGEAYLAGAEAERARARFPIYAIEGCEQACASAWLAGIGVRQASCFFLRTEGKVAVAVERIARLAS